jgi:hypothetical protein
LMLFLLLLLSLSFSVRKEEDKEEELRPRTLLNNIASTAASCLCTWNRLLLPINDFNFVFAHFEPSIPQNEDRTNAIIKTSANRYRRFMLTFLLNNQRKNFGTRNMKPFPFKHGTTIVFIPRCCLFLDIIVAPLSTSILVKGLFESSISFALFTRSRIFVWYCFCLLVLAFCFVMRRLQEKRNVNEE